VIKEEVTPENMPLILLPAISFGQGKMRTGPKHRLSTSRQWDQATTICGSTVRIASAVTQGNAGRKGQRKSKARQNEAVDQLMC